MMRKTSAAKRSCAIDCFFPQCKTRSPLGKRTECEVRRDSFDKEHLVVAESDAIHMLCAVDSFKAAR